MEEKPTPTLSDFPKLECPFIRRTFSIDRDDWKVHGSKLKLKTPEVYLVTDVVNPGFEWVFDDADTFAVEKLDGTNVKIKTEKGRLIAFQNRLNVVDPLKIVGGNPQLLEGILNASAKDYVLRDGEQAGEIIGPKLQGNPYKLPHHLWYPFEKTIENLRYRSFNEHPRTFANLSTWFKDHLQSRFYFKFHKVELKESPFAEGVIFYNLKRKENNQSWRAKLRRDMFDWFYTDQIKVHGYTVTGENGKLPNSEMD